MPRRVQSIEHRTSRGEEIFQLERLSSSVFVLSPSFFSFRLFFRAHPRKGIPPKRSKMFNRKEDTRNGKGKENRHLWKNEIHAYQVRTASSPNLQEEKLHRGPSTFLRVFTFRKIAQKMTVTPKMLLNVATFRAGTSATVGVRRAIAPAVTPTGQNENAKWQRKRHCATDKKKTEIVPCNLVA